MCEGGAAGRPGTNSHAAQLPHGDFESLFVDSGVQPQNQVLDIPSASFEVNGAALFHGDVEGSSAEFSGHVSAQRLSASRGSFSDNLSTETFTASEATVVGNVSCKSLLETSDARLKRNIMRLQTNALDLIMRIQVYSYSLCSDATEERHTGFLAQQLREVIPSVVVERNGRLQIKPTGLTAFLAKALQDFRVENRQQWAVQNAANQVLLTAIRDLGSHIEVPSPYGAQDCAAVAGDNMDIDQLFEGGEEEEVWDAASPDDTGGSSGRSEGLDGSTSAGRNPLAALSVQEAIQYLKAALSEKNPGIAGLYGKLLNDLDRDEIYGAMQQALISRGITASGERLRDVGGEFIKLCKKRVASKKTQAAALVCAAPRELRQYQQRALRRLAAGENILLVLPTGGGKTEVALQHTLALLRADPRAKTVMLVPNIALAYQQAGYFERKGSFTTEGGERMLRVACYSSDNQLAPRNWQAALDSHDVIIGTGQTLLNALNGGFERLAAVRFLVFDEVHHAKLEHPYNSILKKHYSQLPVLSRNRVQVLGMTATPGAHVSQSTTEMLWTSLANSINGSYEIAGFEDPEVQLHVSRATERPPIIVAPLPEDSQFLLYTCNALLDTLEELQSENSAFTAALPSACGELNKGRFSPALQTWITGLLEPRYVTPQRVRMHVPGGLTEDLASCLLLMAACNSALLVREEAGHKAGIDYIGRAFMQITERSSMAHTSELSDTRWAAWKGLVGRLHEACGQPLQDITIDDAALMATFPKFCALRDFLEECCAKQPEFHGMVFVRTRLGLYLVEKALRAEASLSSVSFSRLIGKGTGGGPVAVSTARGMSGKEQAQILEKFREPGGRKVLVATAAGLEGLDVPDCNFCVRYNASQTAIERVQSRGRTRKAAAEFIEIFESGSQDGYFQRKSFIEERNMAHMANHCQTLEL